MEPEVQFAYNTEEDSRPVSATITLPALEDSPEVLLHITGVIRMAYGSPEHIAVVNVRSEWPPEFIGTGPNMNAENLVVLYGLRLTPEVVVAWFTEHGEEYAD